MREREREKKMEDGQANRVVVIDILKKDDGYVDTLTDMMMVNIVMITNGLYMVYN